MKKIPAFNSFTILVIAVITIGALVILGATVIGFSDWSLMSTPANPGSGFLRLYSDNGTATVKCLQSSGAACFFATSVAGVTIQTNGVNNSSQTALNLKSGGSVVVSNPSGGDVNITGPAFQTNGSGNATQTTLNLKAGTNITLTNSGADVTIGASGGGTTLTLQVNGTPNGSQTLLNLAAGTNVTLTDNGTGTVTIASTGGGGGVSTVTATAPITSSGGANPNISATYRGNGSLIQLGTGSFTTNHLVKFDVNGNTVDAGSTVSLRAVGMAFGMTGTSALSAGSAQYVTVPFGCTIQRWDMTVDSGTATVDIWKIASGSAIPTISNTITASAKPAISSGTAATSATLTGWTTSVTAGDILGFHLDAVSSANALSIVLECQQ